MKLGPIVKAIRGIGGWTQDEFAVEASMSRSAISLIENDKQSLDVPTLIRMVMAVNNRVQRTCGKASHVEAAALAITIGPDGLSMVHQLLQAVGVA